MQPIAGREAICAAYRDAEAAEQYVTTRFASAWGSVVHEAQVKALNECIRAWGVRRVLELAPGPGRLTGDVTGFKEGYLCDANESMLHVAQRRLREVQARRKPSSADGRWRLIRGDAFAPPFRGPFDMVYAFRLIRHFSGPDRAALYAQIHALLRAGGIFVLDAVNVRVALPARVKNGLEKHPVYDELYRRDALVKEIGANGFQVPSLQGVMRHMTLQQWTQEFIGPRWHGLAKRVIRSLEYVPGPPLEWIAVCRKASR